VTTGFCAVTEHALIAWREARRRLLRKHAGSSSTHAWRISSRRLFALEQLLTPYPSQHPLHDALHRAFRSSGRLRDTQVALRLLADLSERFPAATSLARQLRKELVRRRRHTTRHARAIKTRTLRQIVDAWRPAHREGFESLAQRRAERRLRLALAPRHVPTLRTRRDVHRQRLRLKSLRYMTELCDSAGCRPPSTASTPQELARLQSLLGEITDLQVLLRMIKRRGQQHSSWRRKSIGLRRELVCRRRQLLTRLP
jgi:CHAD domain-containing protein